jgi:hypothetical protein
VERPRARLPLTALLQDLQRDLLPAPLGPAIITSWLVEGLGLVLFGLATWLGRQLPRGGAALLAIGGVLIALPVETFRLELVTQGLGLIWLGYAVWSRVGELQRE